MRGPQNNAWRLAGFKSLLPTRGTQTPAIARFQAGKAELPHRRRQIITARFRIRKKLRRHYGTDGVAADVFLARIAAAVAIETCHGLERTDFQRLAKHIPGWNRSSASVAAFVSEHALSSPELQANRHSTEFYNSNAFGQSITTWTDGSRSTTRSAAHPQAVRTRLIARARRNAATRRASTNAAGPRRCAPRWRLPFSVQPTRPAACRG